MFQVETSIPDRTSVNNSDTLLSFVAKSTKRTEWDLLTVMSKSPEDGFISP